MSSTPNYKARLQRASRNNVPTYSVFESFNKTKWFTLFLVIIFPIYPSLSALTTQEARKQVSIGDYDESSILASFTDTDGLEYISETGLVIANTSTSSGHEIVEEAQKSVAHEKIPESNTRTYVVVEYDDVIKIWKKFNIDPEVILWSNNLSMNDTLKVGQALKIPAISGVVHVLQPYETVSDLAKIYNVSSQKILDHNNISDARKIRDGAKLMIPWAIKKAIETPKPTTSKEVKKPVESQKNAEKTTNKTSIQSQKTNTTVEAKKVDTPAIQSSDVNPATWLKDRYEVKYTGKGRGFVAGNCTWHVARNKNVTWRGNANQWIKNAKKEGVPTGKTPITGAIVQFSGHGYNSYYGHVGIVIDMTDTHIIVSDMNYAWLYKVTIRKVLKTDPAIDGYIYVD